MEGGSSTMSRPFGGAQGTAKVAARGGQPVTWGWSWNCLRIFTARYAARRLRISSDLGGRGRPPSRRDGHRPRGMHGIAGYGATAGGRPSSAAERPKGTTRTACATRGGAHTVGRRPCHAVAHLRSERVWIRPPAVSRFLSQKILDSSVRKSTPDRGSICVHSSQGFSAIGIGRQPVA